MPTGVGRAPGQAAQQVSELKRERQRLQEEGRCRRDEYGALEAEASGARPADFPRDFR